MKFGYTAPTTREGRGDRQPVVVTSQNHGFAVDSGHAAGELKSTHVSLFDGSLQGLKRTGPPGVLASRATPRRARGRTTSATSSTGSRR